MRRFRLESADTVISSEIEPVGLFGDRTLLFRGHLRGETPPSAGLRRNRIRMMRFNLEGRYLGSLGEFDDQSVRYGLQGAEYVFGPWAKEAPADSTMWYGSGDRFELREVAFDGRVRRLVRLDRPNRPVADADRDAYADAMLGRYRGTPQETRMNQRLANAIYAPEFPAHLELLMDDVGNLWVQDYQPFTARVPRRWTVFDPDGRFLGDVELPAGVAVKHIGDDFLLGTWRDEYDVEYIRLYALEKR